MTQSIKGPIIFNTPHCLLLLPRRLVFSMVFVCKECSSEFTRHWNYTRHMSRRHNIETTESRDDIPKDIESETEPEESSGESELDYGTDEDELPDPWEWAILNTLGRLRKQHEDECYPDNVLQEPHLTEFVEELQKTVKFVVANADAFSNDSTYKIIMKHFLKLHNEGKGHDEKENLAVAWMEKKFYVKKRLEEHIKLFGESSDDSAEGSDSDQ